MAGPDAVYDGIFRQCGIIRARSVTELFDFCWVLGALPLPAGERVVIQTHSGGPGAAAADHCGREGLDLPLLSPETVERLRSFLPHTASLGNPVDMTFARNQMDYFGAIPDVLLREPGADLFLLYILVPSLMVERSLELMGLPPEDIARETRKLIEAQTASLAGLIRTYGKPVIGYTYRGIEEAFCRRLMEHGVPVFAGPERAARAMAALTAYRRIVDRRRPPA
jgi:acyl-CoA synthetase (NDP forming)